MSDERLKMARPLIKEQEVGLNWYTLQVIYNLKTKYGYFREKSHDIKILQMTPTHTKILRVYTTVIKIDDFYFKFFH